MTQKEKQINKVVEFLETKGFEFDKDKDMLYFEEYFCNEMRLKEYCELMIEFSTLQLDRGKEMPSEELKPLSEITDEDAIEVLKCFVSEEEIENYKLSLFNDCLLFKHLKYEFWNIRISFKSAQIIVDDGIGLSSLYYLNSYSYLQSKGYKLPVSLLPNSKETKIVDASGIIKGELTVKDLVITAYNNGYNAGILQNGTTAEKYYEDYSYFVLSVPNREIETPNFQMLKDFVIGYEKAQNEVIRCDIEGWYKDYTNCFIDKVPSEETKCVHPYNLVITDENTGGLKCIKCETKLTD